jgi:hypothetical protein
MYKFRKWRATLKGYAITDWESSVNKFDGKIKLIVLDFD